MRSIQWDREREEEIALFREWKGAKTRRRREAAFLELCRRSKKASRSAQKYLAEKYNVHRAKHVTYIEWRKIHRITAADANTLTALAVVEAGETFDPERAKGNNRFTTYAYSFLVGKLYATASVLDAANHADLDVDDRTYADKAAAWKAVGEKRQPVIGGYEDDHDVEDCTDRRLRILFELEASSGAEKIHARTAFLEPLDRDALKQLRKLLENNKERAVATYGLGRWLDLRVDVWFEAAAKSLPPEVQNTDFFANKAKDGLIPLQGVAIRTDGKTWDLDAPVRAEILENQGKRKRQTARLLGIKWSTYKDLRKRMEKQGFSLDHFTTEELEAIALGNQGRSPKA